MFPGKLPLVRAMLRDVGQEGIEEVRGLMGEETLRIEEANGMGDGKAGVLKGTAVVGWGG